MLYGNETIQDVSVSSAKFEETQKNHFKGLYFTSFIIL